MRQRNAIERRKFLAGGAGALGAAFMAGLKIGEYKSLHEIKKKWKVKKTFIPKLNNSHRKKLINQWIKSVKKALIH